MAVNPKTKDLIIAIVGYCNERGIEISKMKLLMLLYLFDIEWYRTHGETFTGFEWINE